ncbi:aspartyl protease family protein [Flavivirga aquimarina]|uniref:Aspartyl protease family protein n=1 Tax=Flavivirga aquimarina TaxID=2027862 RepID=A0ABT8WET3_9FLAO|nr:aspartyl protease family protein [Flavivirga aquimarina]MDO5971668.1 aspartyl protease family protein [Flavivirga aquimarina]
MKIIISSINKFFIVISIFFCFSNLGFSQNEFVIQNKKKSDKISFKLISNLIILPVEVNGVKLSFLLDTGVSKTILFNVSDTLKIKNTETIFLRGLGDKKSVEALKSRNNVFKIGDVTNFNQDLYAIYDSNLNFTPRLGIPVHGIIGFDLFKDLIVEISYSKKVITLTKPEKYKYKKCKKCERLNLEFYNNKPYINAEVTIEEKKIPIKLLIDSGGSDALWLFEDNSLGIKSSNNNFYDFLGHGLSGSVYGKRSKVKSLSLKSFELKMVNVSYPDSVYISQARKIKDRNGSVSGNVLKRFNVIFDYQNAMITLNKNGYFNDKFRYNKSGIELAHSGYMLVKEREGASVSSALNTNYKSQNATKIIINPRYKLSLKPSYVIVELRKNSPAEKTGLLVGDSVLSVNGKQAYQFKLQELIQMFYGNSGKLIKIVVSRNNIILAFEFKLEDLFK